MYQLVLAPLNFASRQHHVLAWLQVSSLHKVLKGEYHCWGVKLYSRKGGKYSHQADISAPLKSYHTNIKTMHKADTVLYLKSLSLRREKSSEILVPGYFSKQHQNQSSQVTAVPRIQPQLTPRESVSELAKATIYRDLMFKR